MNCPESHDLLQDRLDGRPPPDRTTLESHLASCAECRERHAAALRLADGLSRLSPPAPPAGLRERIVAGVLAERRAILRSRRLWTAAAVAAGLLLAALAGYQAYRGGLFGDRGAPEVAGDGAKDQRPPVVDHRPQDSPRALSMGETFEEAGVTALALTRRTAGETVARARRWLPEGSLGLPTSPFTSGHTLAPVLDPPAQSLRQASESVTAGLKPVTSSARRAVELFLKQIPPMGSGS